MLTHFESWCRRLLPVALVSVGCLCNASRSVLAQSTPGWQVVETQPQRSSKPRTFQGDEPALQLADSGAMSFHSATALVSASVVRIDHGQAGKLWQPAATGFLIGTVQGRYLILTNAHVVEDEDNDHKLLETSQLRGIVGGSGAELRVQKIFLHPKREDGHGPDVAILEAKCLDDDAKLRPLTLLPRGHNEPLLGASVAVIGFPNFNGGVKSKPSFSQGSVVQEDAEESALLYDAMTTHGSSGSPVFALTAHQSSRAAGVIVVGVNAATRPIREGGGLFGTTTGALRVAVPVRFAWDIIDEQQLTVGQGEIAFEPSKPNGTTTPLSLQPVNAIQPPLSNPLPLTVKLAEQGKFAEALQLVEVTFASGATHREPLPTALCVAGQLRIERGLQLQQAGDESAARDCFIAAEQHLERAVQADPKLVTATLFLARARANLGRPLAGQSENQAKLKAAHNAANELLEGTLTRRERAQAVYVLAFVHQFLPCGGVEKARRGFQESFELSPSRQSEESYYRLLERRTVKSELPTLWDDLDRLANSSQAETQVAGRQP